MYLFNFKVSRPYKETYRNGLCYFCGSSATIHTKFFKSKILDRSICEHCNTKTKFVDINEYEHPSCLLHNN